MLMATQTRNPPRCRSGQAYNEWHNRLRCMTKGRKKNKDCFILALTLNLKDGKEEFKTKKQAQISGAS
jgi:hypothetical protein